MKGGMDMEDVNLRKLEEHFIQHTYEGQHYGIKAIDVEESMKQLYKLLKQYQITRYDIQIHVRHDRKHIKIAFDVDSFDKVEEPSKAYHIPKKIPIGIDRYTELTSGYYYVDKTEMIKSFLDSGDLVTLITRPRRFGKTLNLSMMAEFFDITKDNSTLFEGTFISYTDYMKYRNSYPVIFISFKDCKGEKRHMCQKIYWTLWNVFEQFTKQLNQLDDESKMEFIELRNIIKQKRRETIDLDIGSEALLLLCKMYYHIYQKPVILLIDEYDTPFMSAYTGGYYDKVKDFLSDMLSCTLKGNPYLYRAVLTGCQRIAKENIFSGLNNLEVCSLQDEQYANCFGFTEAETRKLLQYYGKDLNEEVKAMYDGYHIGSYELYNPWSILNYAKKGRLASYWVNTGSHQMLKQWLEDAPQSFFDQMRTLLEDRSIDIVCNLVECYYQNKKTSQIWAQLIHAGYLTIDEVKGNHYYKIRIVNKEVKEELVSILHDCFGVDDSIMREVSNALLEGNKELFQEKYETVLRDMMSYHDLKDENSYHILMLCVYSFMSKEYVLLSNKETGYGRADIYLKSKKGQKDIVIELKHRKQIKGNQDLKKLAFRAIQQIEEHHYAKGKRAIAIGIAHSGKRCEIVWKE